MKANELRIGNFIEDDNSNVVEITSDNIQHIVNRYWLKVHHPIPLTEEWLLKFYWNGYKDLCINSYFTLDTAGHLYYHGDYTGINIKYVHQLQNLYHALTGEELTLTS